MHVHQYLLDTLNLDIRTFHNRVIYECFCSKLRNKRTSNPVEVFKTHIQNVKALDSAFIFITDNKKIFLFIIFPCLGKENDQKGPKKPNDFVVSINWNTVSMNTIFLSGYAIRIILQKRFICSWLIDFLVCLSNLVCFLSWLFQESLMHQYLRKKYFGSSSTTLASWYVCLLTTYLQIWIKEDYI